jgi:hypothetical protein
MVVVKKFVDYRFDNTGYPPEIEKHVGRRPRLTETVTLNFNRHHPRVTMEAGAFAVMVCELVGCLEPELLVERKHFLTFHMVLWVDYSVTISF